jgi:hypothetical protein
MHPLGLSSDGLLAFKKIVAHPAPGKSAHPGPLKNAQKRINLNKSVKDVANTPVRLAVPQPERKQIRGDKEAEPKLIDIAKKRFQIASDSEADIRKEALDDLRFFAGDQWPDEIRRAREKDGRPCLTINMMPMYTRTITNEQRQNRPSVQVNPVDDDSDPKTAEIIQGIMRHIEYESGADAAYDTAFQYAAIASFGYWRVITEYSGPMSFEQDIKIRRIRNPFTVYFDPNCKEPDYSDANWAFIIESLGKDEYKLQYPNSKMSDGTFDDWQSIGDGGWSDKDTCRVVEYFYKESVEKTIALLSDGSTVLKEYLGDLPDEITIKNERKTQIEVVKWVKMNGVEVLEETDWAGRWIPIVPVLGEELDVDGKRVLQGIVRNARDPQKQYNFMASATTETIALAPKAPFIAAEGQIEGHEQEWQTANIKNQSVLTYKNVSSTNGQPMPAPQRQTFEPAIQATTMAMMQSAQDLKNTTGIQEAELGAPSNEKSGKAILARQQQSQGANFHFADNLSRSMRHNGRIILDLIPKIYDTERVIRIIGDDGKQSTVRIGQPDPQQQQDVEKIYDLSVGKYDVTISTGPSFQTKRQEAVESQMQLISAPLILDIVVGNMDWPEAQKLAKRLKTALPPQVAQADNEEEGSPIPPEVQQQLAQLLDQNQQLTQHLQSATENIEKGLSQKQAELESKERIAFAQVDVDRQKLTLEYAKLQKDLVVADITAKAEGAQMAMQHEMDTISQLIDQAHEVGMAEMGHEHQQDIQEQQVEGQSQLSAQNAQQSQDSAQPTAQQ